MTSKRRQHEHFRFRSNSGSRFWCSSCAISSEMPATIPHVRLAGVGPSAQEVAEAKQMIKNFSPKEARSKMASMVAWLQANGTDNQEVKESRGNDRQRYLSHFLVHCMRSKNAKKGATNSRVVSTENQKNHDTEFVGLEELKTKMGETKAMKLVKGNKLETRPCKCSGEDTEGMREYRLTNDWERERPISTTVRLVCPLQLMLTRKTWSCWRVC